ncbi:MAG: hypothetical protein OXH77_09150 [Anaerolineaceae bacterium]|nr:hypothetical protein [Anaerolineaceae bacterium]
MFLYCHLVMQVYIGGFEWWTDLFIMMPVPELAETPMIDICLFMQSHMLAGLTTDDIL